MQREYSGLFACYDLFAVIKQALVALEQCFLHEGGAFLDAARFQQLLKPLVAQLPSGPQSPAPGLPDSPIASTLRAVLPQELAEEAGTWGPSPAGGLSVDTDPFGIAVAAALVRFASAASSDTHHRPLNRAVRFIAFSGSRSACSYVWCPLRQGRFCQAADSCA